MTTTKKTRVKHTDNCCRSTQDFLRVWFTKLHNRGLQVNQRQAQYLAHRKNKMRKRFFFDDVFFLKMGERTSLHAQLEYV
jgi:hypothetical protein